MSDNRKDDLRIADPIVIETERFVLRRLTEADVSERYLQWFANQDARRFITAASNTTTLSVLREYVRDRIDRDDIVFLGIFERHNFLHIGNIKYEPLDSTLGYAIMGILVGERAWRGKGVASEALMASADWLCRHRKIRQIVLGVSRSNIAAILTYQKVGFVEASTRFIPNISPENMTMVWELKSSKPE